MEEIRQRAAFDRMRVVPELQAEIIAKHYLAHAELAKNILRLIAERPHSDFVMMDHIINQLVDQIKANHRDDLGIELKWE